MAAELLAQLYRAYAPAIFGCCRALLLDEAAAMDATQDTFLRVHKHLARVPSGEEALTWIYRIATNVCLNRIRDAQRLAQRHQRAPLPRGGEADPSGRMAERDLVRQLIGSLPERVATAAWLHYVDGLDQGETARVLGVSRNTVVNRLAAFRKLARDFLENHDG